MIQDAESGELLIGVNIQIKGLLEGTSTNEDGEFTLSTFNKNPMLVVSYVGYKSIEVEAKTYMEIQLKPDMLSSDIVYVYGQGLSPAQRIVMRTIDTYIERFRTVDNFSCNTYAKQYFYFPRTKEEMAKNDSLLRIGEIEKEDIKPRNPYVLESYKEVNWKKPNKIKTTILKRNQGRVIPAMFNFLGGMNYQNIFDPKYNLEKSPFHHESFDDYHYTIQDTVLFRADSAFVIRAVPKDTSNHWKYNAYIGKNDFLMKHFQSVYKSTIGRKYLTIGAMSSFGAKNVTLQQDYHLINNIPFPKNFIVNHITRKQGTIRLTEKYSNFLVNTTNDVYFGIKQLELADDVDTFNENTWKVLRPEPLSPHETLAYTKADSLYETLPPTQKFLLDYGLKYLFLDIGIGDHKLSSISDVYRYNPVEGHYFGVGFTHPEYKHISTSSKFGYSSGLNEWFGELTLKTPLSLKYDIDLTVHPFKKIQPIDSFNHFSPKEESFLGFFLHERRHHYLKNKGFLVDLTMHLTKYTHIGAFYKKQTYSSLQNTSTFSLKDNGKAFSKNLQVVDSNEDEYGLTFAYRTYDTFELGAFKTENFIENGWDATLKLVMEARSLKSINARILKSFVLGKRTELELQTVAYYTGKDQPLSRTYFPRVFSYTSGENNFHISGFKPYGLATFDYYSAGGSFIYKRLIPWFRPGTLFLNAMMFSGNNYGNEKLGDIHLLDNKVYGEFGLAFFTSRLSFPLRLLANYNTYTKKPAYKIDLYIKF